MFFLKLGDTIVACVHDLLSLRGTFSAGLIFVNVLIFLDCIVLLIAIILLLSVCIIHVLSIFRFSYLATHLRRWRIRLFLTRVLLRIVGGTSNITLLFFLGSLITCRLNWSVFCLG